MKKTIKTLLLLFCVTTANQTTFAQQNARGIKDPGVKSCGNCGMTSGRIYFGGNYNNAPSVGQSQYSGGKSSTFGFNMDYSHTLVKYSRFSIDINGGGSYFSGSQNPFSSSVPAPFKVNGQITNVVTTTDAAKNSGYTIGVGPQFNIHIVDQLVFSPVFQLAYVGVTQIDFKATQTTVLDVNVSKNYDLITKSQTSTSGLGFIPKARISYMFNDNWGVWGEASYLVGPTVKSEITVFKPSSDPTLPPPSSYTVSQMDAGTYTKTVTESKYNAVGFGFGVMYGFGNKK